MMARSSTLQFGTLLRELRERVGLSEGQLASSLNVKVSLIQEWEAGQSNSLFTVSREGVLRLREAALASTTTEDLAKLLSLLIRVFPENPQPSRKVSRGTVRTRKQATQAPLPTIEEASNITQILQKSGSISSQKELNVLKDLEHQLPIQDEGDPSAAQGTNVPDAGLDEPIQRDRGRKSAGPEHAGQSGGVVYERELAQFKREYLQESAKPLSELLVNTLQNNNDPLSPVAEEAMRIFTKAALKEKGITLNKASRELHISVASLSDFVRKGLVPTLYRNKGAIYLEKNTAEELGRDLEDAREMGMQPARLLRERREKYFPKATK
jgi:transcriptional regulator with XRE-family HTH domain